MSTASMSPLLHLPGTRKHYLCAKCKDEQHAPVSDSAPLRVLHLYVTVAATDGLPTPVRMKPMSIVLEAPPDSFAWCSPKLHTALTVRFATKAVPTQFHIAEDRRGNRLMGYLFVAEGSTSLLCCGEPFHCGPGSNSSGSLSERDLRYLWASFHKS